MLSNINFITFNSFSSKKLIRLNNIIIDSKSGFSGAGRNVHKKYKNKNLYESLSAYGVGFHRHNSEIEQTLMKYSKKEVNFNFTPHLSPMFRGILSTIYIEVNKNINQSKIRNVLRNYYKNDIFIKILKNDSLVSTNDVINTNNCHISICKTKYKNKFVILSTIDNLIKGGSGQAVQNMNLRFGFPLKTGLNMKYLNIIFLLIIFQSCSFNNDSKYWNEHYEKNL